MVERWGLSNLKQVKYGKLEIPKKYFHKGAGVPYTPIIWTTIITGAPPEEHGIREWWSYGRFLDWVKRKPPLIWVKNKRKYLWRLGLKPHVIRKEDWLGNRKTIFELVKPSIPLFIPGYNEATEYHEMLNLAIKYGGLREYISMIWRIHRLRKVRLWTALQNKKGWKLFMVWLDIADLLGHVCWHKCLDELMNAYLDLDRLAKSLKQELGNEPTYILIISDHGMQDSSDGVTGNHSTHAFWSQNINDDWVPKDFTDYKTRIIEMSKR